MIDYQQDGKVAVITMDDGKANAVSHTLMDGLNEALDRAQKDAGAVLLRGRDGVFSAGFDLKEIQKGADAASALVGKGARLFLRLYGHPQPLVAQSTGHAIAAGAFMLLSADTRIGTTGDYKTGLNETAIGMTLPPFGYELATARLSKRHVGPAFIQATLYDPLEAVDAGFLDQALTPEDAAATALAIAARLAELPGQAYAGNKQILRRDTLAAIERSLA